MASFSDEQLRPYGYVRGPGHVEGFCGCCQRQFKGCGPGGFKCRPCAAKQASAVEEDQNYNAGGRWRR
jgi:hypothetical protein